MKTTILKAYASKAATLAATLLLATACSNELPQEPTGEGDNSTSQPGTPLTLSANLPTSGKADTRLGYDDLTTNGVKVSWTQGDAFRLYTNKLGLVNDPTPVNAGLFTLDKIDGDGSASFSGTQTATSETYAAYYPAKKFPEKVGDFSPEIPLNGQIQKGNGDMTHLADYNFMKAINIDNLTSIINFEPMMTLLTFDLTMPSDMTGTPIEIKVEASGQTNSEIFQEWLFDVGPASKVLTLGLKDITLKDDRKLKAYMLVYPFTMDNHDLSIIVTTDAGKTYTKTPNLSRECIAGQRYTISIEYTGADEGTATNVFTDAVAITNGTEPALKTPGSDNSKSNPYLIATASNLQWLVKNPAKVGWYYKLTTDIYVSATTWTPIGSSSLTFRGHFDGDNHSINGTLKLADGNFDSSLYFGFFGYMNGASVNNLNVNADVAAGTQEYTGSTTYISAYIGGIAGQMANSDLSNCSYNGNLTGAKITVGSSKLNTINLYTGGIAGVYNATSDKPCTLTGCTNTGTIIGGINTTNAGIVSTGGILGGRFGGKATLHTCLNTGDVKTNAETTSSADNSVGGIFGNDPANITIYDCCNHTGTVYGIDGNPVAGNPWTSRSGFIPTTCPDKHPKR